MIIIINLSQFQKIHFFDLIHSSERPIIQSLVSFIAFDRIITLLKTTKFKPSILFDKVKDGIDQKLKQLDENQ